MGLLAPELGGDRHLLLRLPCLWNFGKALLAHPGGGPAPTRAGPGCPCVGTVTPAGVLAGTAGRRQPLTPAPASWAGSSHHGAPSGPGRVPSIEHPTQASRGVRSPKRAEPAFGDWVHPRTVASSGPHPGSSWSRPRLRALGYKASPGVTHPQAGREAVGRVPGLRAARAPS